mmetsp:Transcript_14071/g.22364  ORF Transcript_14071/g.22364 Transcript_14071/m.22364 type:complete len:300 (+) Transcript_14071:75-974(+)
MGFRVDETLRSGSCLAIVTGANKGIGFRCVERLCEELDDSATVVLTSRSEERGKAAVAELVAKGHKQVIFHLLDVTNAQSIDALAEWVKKRGGCDIVINNAGIAFKLSAPEPFADQARKTVDANYYGTKHVVEKLLPHLKSGGRMIQVSSQAGQIGGRPGAAKFLSDELSIEVLDAGLENFVAAAVAGKVTEGGFWNSAYGVSKMGVTQYTRLAAKKSSAAGTDVLISSCCPGLCRTDMTGGNKQTAISWLFWLATWIPGIGQSAYTGADTPVYLALLRKDEFATHHGMFCSQRRVQGF